MPLNTRRSTRGGVAPSWTGHRTSPSRRAKEFLRAEETARVRRPIRSRPTKMWYATTARPQGSTSSSAGSACFSSKLPPRLTPSIAPLPLFPSRVIKKLLRLWRSRAFPGTPRLLRRWQLRVARLDSHLTRIRHSAATRSAFDVLPWLIRPFARLLSSHSMFSFFFCAQSVGFLGVRSPALAGRFLYIYSTFALIST